MWEGATVWFESWRKKKETYFYTTLEKITNQEMKEKFKRYVIILLGQLTSGRLEWSVNLPSIPKWHINVEFVWTALKSMKIWHTCNYWNVGGPAPKQTKFSSHTLLFGGYSHMGNNVKLIWTNYAKITITSSGFRAPLVRQTSNDIRSVQYILTQLVGLLQEHEKAAINLMASLIGNVGIALMPLSVSWSDLTM